MKAQNFQSSTGKVILPKPASPQAVTPGRMIDDTPVVEANLLEIDFVRETYDRSRLLESVRQEPEEQLLFAIANEWIQRLRMVLSAPKIKPLTGSEAWAVEYLNDDGTEIAPDPLLFRRRFSVRFTDSFAAVDADVLAAIDQLRSGYEAPKHRMLLLDAVAIMPELGSAIVLGATALEIAIEAALENRASQSDVPPELWDWIADRGDDYRKQPSVEEKFDILLAVFFGKSLKSEIALWNGFKDLKKARNTFVHTGRLELNGKLLDASTVSRLLENAGQILDWLDSSMPEDLKHRRLQKKFECSATTPAFPTDL